VDSQVEDLPITSIYTPIQTSLFNCEYRLHSPHLDSSKMSTNEKVHCIEQSNLELRRTRHKYDREELISFQRNYLSLIRAPELPLHFSCMLSEACFWPVNDFNNAWQEPNDIPPINNPKVQTLPDVETFKKFRSILNKLTPQKFDKLLGQVMELKITTENRLAGVVQILLDKASMEPHFAEMYAQLSSAMSNLNPTYNCNFRSCLISACERNIADINFKLKPEDAKSKLRRIGFCSFLGELYNHDLLRVRTVLNCIEILMNKADEDSLEGLCKIMTKIGSKLDRKGTKSKCMVDRIFADMNQKVKSIDTEDSRLRFMLMDLKELRIKGWEERATVARNKPATLAQIQQKLEDDPSYTPTTPRTPQMESSIRHTSFTNKPIVWHAVMAHSSPTMPQVDLTPKWLKSHNNSETPRKTGELMTSGWTLVTSKSNRNSIASPENLMPHWLMKKSS
jgi:hypothetical protein